MFDTLPPQDETEKPPTPLTDQAVARLRELATGNGADPEQIQLRNTDERDVTLTGIMVLVPKVEANEQRLVGRGIKLPEVVKSFTAFSDLSSHIQEVERKYLEGRDWFNEVKNDLDKQPGKGWGLESARVILDSKQSDNFSATETCTRCFGNGVLGCDYCAGKGYKPCHICYERGFEQCYNCFGVGTDPADRDKPCVICNGRRTVVCRTCQGTKGIPCGTCQGNGVLPCPPCDGGGKLVRLVTMEYGAEATFSSGSGADLPSALRRALDRGGGLKMLANGHATIDYTVPKDEEQKPGQAVINYTAKLRCADAVIQFVDENKRIAIFGNRNTMLEVPAFIDKTLAEGLALLEEAKKGKVNFHKALAFRAIAEAAQMVLNGNGRVDNLRKLYPVGISKPVIQQILAGVKQALARVTVAARWAGFIASFIVADVLGGVLYITPLHRTLLETAGRQGTLAIEMLVPLFCAIVGYILTGQAALFHLRRQFPQAKPALHHHGGLLGVAAAVMAFVVPFGIALLYPENVQWLHYFGRG